MAIACLLAGCSQGTTPLRAEPETFHSPKRTAESEGITVDTAEAICEDWYRLLEDAAEEPNERIVDAMLRAGANDIALRADALGDPVLVRLAEDLTFALVAMDQSSYAYDRAEDAYDAVGTYCDRTT